MDGGGIRHYLSNDFAMVMNGMTMTLTVVAANDLCVGGIHGAKYILQPSAIYKGAWVRREEEER